MDKANTPDTGLNGKRPSSPRWRFATFSPDADADEIREFIERLHATDDEDKAPITLNEREEQ